jgi:hypothetical protein
MLTPLSLVDNKNASDPCRLKTLRVILSLDVEIVSCVWRMRKEVLKDNTCNQKGPWTGISRPSDWVCHIGWRPHFRMLQTPDEVKYRNAMLLSTNADNYKIIQALIRERLHGCSSSWGFSAGRVKAQTPNRQMPMCFRCGIITMRPKMC